MAQVWIVKHVDAVVSASCARKEAQGERLEGRELGLCCSHGQMEARVESRGQGGATRGGWEWNLLRRS